jgi:hypothetical protein
MEKGVSFKEDENMIKRTAKIFLRRRNIPIVFKAGVKITVPESGERTSATVPFSRHP